MEGEMIKTGQTIYLSIKRNAVLHNHNVLVKDIAEVYCERKDIANTVRQLVVERLGEKETKVVSALYIIEQIQKQFPGRIIISLGENDVILSMKQERKEKGVEYLKVAFIAFILFFGSAFTIISFQGDTGMEETFYQIYLQIMGKQPNGITILEVSYAVGIVAGVLIFFNHLSGKKVSPEPTPVQVQMREYEMKMDQAFIESVSRKGSEESVK